MQVLLHGQLNFLISSSIVKFITGTRQFIRENSKFLDDCSEVNPSACNKDTGGCKTLHSWSRGVFFVVSAGGHIEYWQPLYRLNCVLEI